MSKHRSYGVRVKHRLYVEIERCGACRISRNSLKVLIERCAHLYGGRNEERAFNVRDESPRIKLSGGGRAKELTGKYHQS